MFMCNQRNPSFLNDGSSPFTSASPEIRLPDSLHSTELTPEMLIQNPCEEFHPDQNLDEIFARLTLSHYNHSPLYSSFDLVRFNNQDPGLASNNNLNGHRFPVGQMQDGDFALQKLGWDNGGVANAGATRSHNHWVGSDIWGLENFWSGSYPTSDSSGYSSNYDWFLPDDSLFARQKEIGRTFSTVPLPNKDDLHFNLQPNSGGTFPRNRLNLSEFHVSGRCSQSLQQPTNRQSVSDLRGSILLLAKDQYGCRLLQEMMKGLQAEEISMIFFELIDHVNELMLDPCGNYVVQKLVEVCTEEQRTQIILIATEVDFQLVSICLNMHGTRAVQKLLEHVTTQNQRAIITSALIPGAVALIKDTNGHHVILHCLKHFSDEDKKYLLNEVTNNCFGIATDKSGCCVLQQCVSHAKGETKDHLMAEIIGNVLDLSEDCYGNYVVQHLISLKLATVTEAILRKLQGKFVSLSRNKYGSNVVEKFYQESVEEYCTRITLELLRDPNVAMLLVDPFGNYVIQSALVVSKGHIRNAILKLIQINAPMMRNNLYGKKLLARVDRGKLRHK